MGHIEVSRLEYVLPGGRELFSDVSFRVASGETAGFIGANGAGKSTLFEILSGELAPRSGEVVVGGSLGLMRQFIGSINDDTTVAQFLAELAPRPIRDAFFELAGSQEALSDDERSQLAYAQALATWAEVGGYDFEVDWDVVCCATLREGYEKSRAREVRSLSGGEQKRLALECLMKSSFEVLLLDEPDNYLDIPGKRWLEAALAATPKTVLMVTHDRELLSNAVSHIITLEGRGAWVHGGGFLSYDEVRNDRLERLEQRHRDWNDEHRRLKQLVQTLREQAKVSSAMSGKYRAMQSRLARFEAAGAPPERPARQNVRMNLVGSRTGKRAIICRNLELAALTDAFNLEVFFGERVAVLGPNGSGKTHLLRLLASCGGAGVPDRERLLAGPAVDYSGEVRLGARVLPGWFSQTHWRQDLEGRTIVEILGRGDRARPGRDRGSAISALRRYELHREADQHFEELSGGQQARFQILLLELEGANLLLLDEPTDNLDLHSAEALERGLAQFEGTVLAVSHDRWFARTFDRFLIMELDGSVQLAEEAPWAS